MNTQDSTGGPPNTSEDIHSDKRAFFTNLYSIEALVGTTSEGDNLVSSFLRNSRESHTERTPSHLPSHLQMPSKHAIPCSGSSPSPKRQRGATSKRSQRLVTKHNEGPKSISNASCKRKNAKSACAPESQQLFRGLTFCKDISFNGRFISYNLLPQISSQIH